MTEGKIFDIKQFAVHDGPGIRTTVFFKGCPLSCWWCHNPEGIDESDDLFYYESKCILCGDCVEVCPEDAVKKADGKISIDREKCSLCGDCAKICPTTALKLAGKNVSVDGVMEKTEKSTVFYDTSDGGVTLSGGEPFLQFDFMKELIERCKEKDIQVTVDTCGHVDKEKFEAVLDDVDLFLYDLKLMDDDLHKRYTGITNEIILENLETLLGDNEGEAIIRLPLVGGITDTEENIEEIINFLSPFSGIKEIDLLVYHDVKEKYDKLGMDYKITSSRSVHEERVKEIKQKFKSEGYRVKVGG